MKRIQLENRTGDLKSDIPLSTPYVIFIDPASLCNFKCKFCMNHLMTSKTVMPFDIYTKLIDNLQEFDKPVKTVRLYGLGEPLQNKSFPEMVRYAKASSKVEKVDTTTNASLLTPELSVKIVEAGLDRVNVSIEAMNTEKYREFTGNKNVTFEKIVENVRHLYSVKNGMTIFVKASGDYLSAEEKDLFYRTFEPISDGCDLEHTMNCWSDFEVAGVNKDVGIYGQPLKEVLVCPYVFYSMFVHADGAVSACFLDWKKKLVVGHTDDDALSTIWNGERFTDIRTGMICKRRKQMGKPCNDCSQLIAGMPVELDEYASEIQKRMEI